MRTWTLSRHAQYAQPPLMHALSASLLLLRIAYKQKKTPFSLRKSPALLCEL